jgi:hypothetical protein
MCPTDLRLRQYLLVCQIHYREEPDDISHPRDRRRSRSTGQHAIGAPAQAAGPDPSKVYIESIGYGGTSCPQGTVGQSISNDRTVATLIFDSFVASSGPTVPVTGGPQELPDQHQRGPRLRLDLQDGLLPVRHERQRGGRDPADAPAVPGQTTIDSFDIKITNIATLPCRN